MAAKPKPLFDFVARFTKPGALMLTRVFRAESKAVATGMAADVTARFGTLAGWQLLDLVTIEDAQARSRGLR